MKKRMLCLLLSCSLLFSWGIQGAWAASPSSEETGPILISDDPADYENGEILALYDDGDCEVFPVGDSFAESLSAVPSMAWPSCSQTIPMRTRQPL